MLTSYTCAGCESENYSGPNTLRTTSSKEFADQHAKKTGHKITAVKSTAI